MISATINDVMQTPARGPHAGAAAGTAQAFRLAFRRAAWRAGASPKMTPTKTETATANHNTGQFRAMTASCGMEYSGMSAMTARTPAYARAMPRNTAGQCQQNAFS